MRRFLKLWLVGLAAGALAAFLSGGCGVIRPPNPNPTPPPEKPPEPQCVEGQTYGCYHNPGSGWVYACPVYDENGGVVGVQNESGPDKCPAAPTPVEPPPLIPDEELAAQDPQDGKVLTWGATDRAINVWRAAHPEKWRGDGACLIDGPAGIDAAFLAIATELKKAGVTAGQSITKGGQRSDAIFVNRAGTSEYEETHIFDYARACAATGPNAVKGVYIRGAGTPPPPPPVPEGCPAEPCPPRVYEDGKPHWHYNAKPHTMGNCDSTPVVDKAWDYCKAIGLGWMDDAQTIPRGSCPMRPDGHPDRVAVENWLLEGGPTIDSRNGQDCRPNHTDNPAAFLNGTGNCRMCNRPKTVCTAWF